ncbi:hypothetical protein psal_cds_75 [Pandoravirus salinus]|uniref:DUF5848 domain-containing protein n=1 Tax=Pandoravirus salinus TaxID=1349410 RepID=S4VSU7_9VIRU|nr:hypothetical protein psal_cds_75 [Pandoravirus salinus]AGO83489.1 hypothetical protein psal_cds_75 [Pandoravirus salinus]
MAATVTATTATTTTTTTTRPTTRSTDPVATWATLVGGGRSAASPSESDFDARRRHDAWLIDDQLHAPDLDMRTLVGAVERVHLLRACSVTGSTLSPLIETTIARLAHGAWVRAPYVQRTAPPGRTSRAHLCDVLVRVYGPFWSHLARAEIMRQPVVAGRVGNPPNPADVLRCLRRDLGLNKVAAARIKEAAPDDPVGAADTIARIFCHVHADLDASGAQARLLAADAAVAEGRAFVDDAVAAMASSAIAPAPLPRPSSTAMSSAAARMPDRLLMVGVAAGCPSKAPEEAGGGSHANGIRFAMVASRTAKPRSDGYPWRWVAWVLWDTRTPCSWEAADNQATVQAETALGCPAGSFVAWLRAAAMRPGTTLPSSALAPQPPPACRPVDPLLLEAATLLASQLAHPRAADAVRLAVARATTGWAPLWDDQIAPYVRAVVEATSTSG